MRSAHQNYRPLSSHLSKLCMREPSVLKKELVRTEPTKLDIYRFQESEFCYLSLAFPSAMNISCWDAVFGISAKYSSKFFFGLQSSKIDVWWITKNLDELTFSGTGALVLWEIARRSRRFWSSSGGCRAARCWSWSTRRSSQRCARSAWACSPPPPRSGWTSLERSLPIAPVGTGGWVGMECCGCQTLGLILASTNAEESSIHWFALLSEPRFCPDEEKWDVLGHKTRTVGSLCFCAMPAAVEVFSMLRPAQGQTELMKSTWRKSIVKERQRNKIWQYRTSCLE